MRLMLAISSALVIVGAITFRIFAWPSIAFPDTAPAVLEARWTELERRAAVFGQAAAASPQLVAAAAAIDEWPDADKELARSRDREPIDPAWLHPAARRAVEALEQWAAEGGDVNDTCMEDARPSAFALFRIGNLGLRSTEAADDPRFAAALRLAAALRQRGSLIGGLVGFQLAGDALKIARARGWHADELLAAHRPTPGEIRALVARESVCTYQSIDRIFDEGCHYRGAADSPWFYPLSIERWCERERQVFKDHWGAVHEAADAFEDLHAFADALELDSEALPPSPVLRATATPMHIFVRDAIDVLDLYDTL